MAKLFPIGIQTFERIIDDGRVYVDKTADVYRLTHSDATYTFLSRPRRFGKSLLCSTLQTYFEGKKEYFKGLAMETLEKEWEERPVLHFDMSGGKHKEKDALEDSLAWRNTDSYWFGSGTPTFLVEMLKKFNVLPSELNSPFHASKDDFDAATETMTSITPLLYQSGYVTIKDFDGLDYTLDIPNKEIRIGLLKALMPGYVYTTTRQGGVTIRNMYRALRNDDIETALRELQTYLPTIPHTPNTNHEWHYQQLLYMIFNLLGEYVDVEAHTATGRIDIVLRTAQTLYVMELKLNKSAQTAMAQIDMKGYAKRFALCGLPVVKVAVNFNSETRTIDGWEVSR